MGSLTQWISVHAFELCSVLLLLALLAGDLAWQYNARRNHDARSGGAEPTVLRLPMALFLLLVLALLFGVIARAISAQPPSWLVSFDTDLAAGLHAHLPPTPLRGVAVITCLGSTLWVVPTAAVVALILLLRRHRRLAVAWCVAQLGILPINGSIKAVFKRIRPLQDHGFISDPGWSFPSGHAFAAMVFYGMLAYVLVRLLPERFHRAVIAAAVLLVGVIGLSRILLQAHYVSDVVAGYAAGAVWLVLCIELGEYLCRGTPGRTA